jgi:hypothetical protein
MGLLIDRSGHARGGPGPARCPDRPARWTAAAVMSRNARLSRAGHHALRSMSGRMRRRSGATSVSDQVPGAEGRDPRSSEPHLRKCSVMVVPMYLIAATGCSFRGWSIITQFHRRIRRRQGLGHGGAARGAHGRFAG